MSDLLEMFNKAIQERTMPFKREPFRVIRAVRVSENHGETWKLRALCEKCWTEIEPPIRRKVEALASTRRCDWCGCRNFQDLPDDKREQFYPKCEPIFTARFDSPQEMAELKSIFGADALTEAYEADERDDAITKIFEKARDAMVKRESTSGNPAQMVSEPIQDGTTESTK